MRSISLTEYNPDLPTLIMMNGGGQPPYTKFDRVTKFFSKFECNIVTFELPGHGKSPFDTILDPDSIISQFRDEFKSLCSEYNDIAVFGYSLGGLYGLHALEVTKLRFTIVVGACITVQPSQEQAMQLYASEEFLDQVKWKDILLSYHTTGYRELLESMKSMLTIGSPLFLEKLPPLDGSHLFHVFGELDPVVSIEAHRKFHDPRYTIYKMPQTTHFDYFAGKWKILEPELQNFVSQFF